MPFTGLLDIQASRRLLNELGEIGFPDLYRENVTPKDRLVKVEIAKQKLAFVEKKVKEEIQSVEAGFEGHNKFDARLQELTLIPVGVT
jgi:hypothetical protein